MAEVTVQESIDQIEAMLAAVTPDQWEIGKHTGDTIASAQEFAAECIAKGSSGTLFMVYNGPGDDARIVALTGNGPTSEANARFIANAPEIVRWLLGIVKQARQEVAEAAD